MTIDRKNALRKFGLNEDGTPIPSPYDVIDDGITDDPFGDRPRTKKSRRESTPAPEREGGEGGDHGKESV
jgi:hypothetical protein